MASIVYATDRSQRRYRCRRRSAYGIKRLLAPYYLNTKTKGFRRQAKNTETVNGKEYRWQLVFLKDAYERILQERRFSPAVGSHELRDANLLLTKDKRRHIYRLVYNRNFMDCCILYCSDEDEMMYEPRADGTSDPEGEKDYEGEYSEIKSGSESIFL